MESFSKKKRLGDTPCLLCSLDCHVSKTMKATGPTRFSICIPHYGESKFLGEAISSACAQSFNNFEVIVSLATSDNEVNAIRESYGKEVKWIDFSSHANIGQHWNYCIENASGDFVVLLHNDDKLHPNYLREIDELINIAKCSAYFCNVIVINESGKPSITIPDLLKSLFKPLEEPYAMRGGRGIRLLAQGNFIFCPTVCYDRTVLSKIKFSEEYQMVLDLEILFRLLINGHKILGTCQKLFYYRRHRNNVTRKHEATGLRFSEETKLFEIIALQCHKKKWFRTELMLYFRPSIRLYRFYFWLKKLSSKLF